MVRNCKIQDLKNEGLQKLVKFHERFERFNLLAQSGQEFCSFCWKNWKLITM